MNNELFADDSPMVEEPVMAPVAAPIPTSGADDMFGEAPAVSSPVAQQEVAPQNDFADDFTAAPIASQPIIAHASPVADDGFFGAPAAVAPSPVAAAPVVASPVAAQASPVADDGFFGAPAAAPIVASPVVASPGSNNSASNLPNAAPSQVFADRGKAKYEAQIRAVRERTAALDVNTKKKEQDIQKKAADYVTEAGNKREIMIATVKADHIRDQQQYEAKMSQFKKSGAVWNSVNLLVDTKKPNNYSKNTEYMRKLIGELQSE